MRMRPVIAAPLPSTSARECLERSEAVGCLSLVMTPDCINGACLFVLSSTAVGCASQANRERVMETTAKDVAVRANGGCHGHSAYSHVAPGFRSFFCCCLYRCASFKTWRLSPLG